MFRVPPITSRECLSHVTTYFPTFVHSKVCCVVAQTFSESNRPLPLNWYPYTNSPFLLQYLHCEHGALVYLETGHHWDQQMSGAGGHLACRQALARFDLASLVTMIAQEIDWNKTIKAIWHLLQPLTTFSALTVRANRWDGSEQIGGE